MKGAVIRGVGAFLIALGIQLALCDSVNLRKTATETVAQNFWQFQSPLDNKIVNVEEHWPFMAIIGGVVLWLWSVTIPAKKAAGK